MSDLLPLPTVTPLTEAILPLSEVRSGVAAAYCNVIYELPGTIGLVSVPVALRRKYCTVTR